MSEANLTLGSDSERENGEIEQSNRRALRRLIVTAEANSQSLELLIAVCDDRNLQAAMIEECETALREKGIAPFRVRLNPKQPSMRASIEELVAREPKLRTGEPAVVTVLNAEALLGVALGEEKSEQERFFYSLQWTREALLRFEFAVVLWVPDAVATRIGQQAPDFWSWRGGVFEFAARAREPIAGALVSTAGPNSEEKESTLSIEALQAQIASLEESSPESALLITSYNSLGEAYERKYAYDDALRLYQKSLKLAEKRNNISGQIKALKNLGDSLRYSGRVLESIAYYQHSIEIAKEVGDHKREANSLNNLGSTYASLGQYQRAVDFHQQSLEIQRGINDRKGEANSLGNLGIAYSFLGQHQQAIDFYQQQLEITREIGDRNGEANSLGNLGIAYYSLGQYQRAIDFYQQQLEIDREIGDRNGEAYSHFNKANALARLDRKWEAQSACEAAKALFESLELKEKVELCETAIRELGQRIAVAPIKAPEIVPAKLRRQRRMPIILWFFAALALVLLVWWLFS